MLNDVDASVKARGWGVVPRSAGGAVAGAQPPAGSTQI
jgi:hypothetical protein